MTDYSELVKALRSKFIAYDVTGNHNSAQLYKDAADAIEELLSFAHYVAGKVTMSDEDWEDYHEAFAEVACRKLVKLGVISIEDDMYVYRWDEPQEAEHE